ncbi:dedicator of cytokinesis protein 7-like [Sycon ciliatum]|uniref:dedicator of cytokinesis protein 7-like n=1 Tax=Sycon ciliatum TaxID=27933 RepID=UPI0020ABB8FD|eukprot:scpid6259/ scgid30162/ Dedicator of cytokinesis protein 7
MDTTDRGDAIAAGGTGGKRAFARRLQQSLPAAEARRIASSVFHDGTDQSAPNTLQRASGVPGHSLVTLDIPRPVDYEGFLKAQRHLVDSDKRKDLLLYPQKDIEVCTEPRYVRTSEAQIPEAAQEAGSVHVKDCVQCYTCDWSMVRRNAAFTQDRIMSLRKIQSDKEKDRKHVGNIQEYEVDNPLDDTKSIVSNTGSRIHTLERKRPSSPTSSLASNMSSATDVSMFDLEMTEEEELFPDLLEDVPVEVVDDQNAKCRRETRQTSLFSLYPFHEELENHIENRPSAPPPAEQVGCRLLVKCLDLQLELEVEPFFAVMALYDVREKKKISENFHFDLNSTTINKMMDNYIKEQSMPSLSRAAVFSITYPHPDIFIVIKLEKVLQKDISECAEPYMKESDTKIRDKVKAAAQQACERLGKYRMPFAWTAVHIQDVVTGGPSQALEHSRRETAAKLEETKIAAKAASERRFEEVRSTGLHFAPGRTGCVSSDSLDPICSQLQSFKPVTLTVNSFFKQEADKLENEDLYKFLGELRKPGSLVRRLKCIPGTLKLDISVPGERVSNSLTSNLVQVKPYPDHHCRPVREVEEFPSREVFIPYSTYKNFLYVYPQHLNFSSRSGSARNIAVRVQLLSGEDESTALKCIYGRSSGPKYTKEAWTAVTYHNKAPDFYEEVKLELPIDLRESHHLLFTFYHISCSKPKDKETGPVEPVLLGYTWLPLLRDGLLKSGDYHFPVTMEKPPQAYSVLTPDGTHCLPNLKWVENHKPVFRFSTHVVSSLHPQDQAVQNFLDSCNQPPVSISRHDPRRHTASGARPGDLDKISGMPSSVSPDSILSNAIDRLVQYAGAEAMMKFLPLLLNKLFGVLIRPGKSSSAHSVNERAFDALAAVIHSAHELLGESCDAHGRCEQLIKYVTYVFNSVALTERQAAVYAATKPDQVNGRPRSSVVSSKTDDGDTASVESRSHDKTIHGEIALQWVFAGPQVKERAYSNSWFFFDIMVKSMAQQLSKESKLSVPPEQRFSKSYQDDVSKLVSNISDEIINRHIKEPRFTQSLNTSLAFFIQDCLSYMDRGFVFGVIRSYLRQISIAAADLNLIEYKLDLLRIVCSHEHYVPLNLPLLPSAMMVVVGDNINSIAYSAYVGETLKHPSRSDSKSDPSASLISSDRHDLMGDDGMDDLGTSSLMSLTRTPSLRSVSSTMTDAPTPLSEDNVYSELSPEYRQIHFLVGLLLTELAVVLDGQSSRLHRQAITALRDLIMSHDIDPRLKDQESRSRIAPMYIPMLVIMMDHYTRFCRDFSAPTGAPQGEEGGAASGSAAPTPTGAGPEDSADGSTNDEASKRTSIVTSTSEIMSFPTGTLSRHDLRTAGITSNMITQENTRNLLICFLWVLKNLDQRQMRDWWIQLDFVKKTVVLDIMDLCVMAFEYKGRGAYYSAFSTTGTSAGATNDVKQRLANVILSGAGSAREKLIERRRQQQGGNVIDPGTRRWGRTIHQQHVGSSLRPMNEVELDIDLESQLGSEGALIVLDTLELIVEASTETDRFNTILSYSFVVLLHLLGANQSSNTLHHIFASQRALVSKHPEFLFEQETEQSSDLCAILLRLCGSALASTRSQASASLFMLMRHNYDLGQSFARVKVQSTVALSTLVAGSQGQSCNADCLRRSLKTILTYADQDEAMSNTPFPEQVKELVHNLHMILRDTVNLNEYKEDPDMLLDLMLRIAKGYANSPDLRLTWLQNMAQKHNERQNLAEAGMCMVHAAALVAEYLSMLEDDSFFPAGCASFEKISPNTLEESAVSDDVLAPDDEGICTGKLFSVQGLLGLLGQAAMLFEVGGLWEAACMLLQHIRPIHESVRDHKKLSKMYFKMGELQKKITDQAGKRSLGAYFRVTFFGLRFDDLDGRDFIYKERPHTSLAEVCIRFEQFYEAMFGAGGVQIIKDSKEPDRAKLDPDTAYIQVVFVEPYFDDYELKWRSSFFEKNFNICRFFFDIPFTESGKSHGDLASQCKRRTILTTANVFPYVKNRIEIGSRESFVLSPVEVALEDLQRKYDTLIEAVRQQPPDVKRLQLQLQGSIGTTVNQGPAEMALVFLANSEEVARDKNLRKLKHCFRDFVRGCAEGLEKNKELISDNQREYQRELERNFVDFRKKLEPIFGKKTSQRWIKKNREKTVLHNIARPSNQRF